MQNKCNISFRCIFFSSGVPKLLQSRFSLPLALVCVPSSPTKTTRFKITVDTNQAPVDLISIFPGENTQTRSLQCSQTEITLKLPSKIYTHFLQKPFSCFMYASTPVFNVCVVPLFVWLYLVHLCLASCIVIGHPICLITPSPSLSLQSFRHSQKIRMGTVWLSSSCQEPRLPCWPPRPPVSLMRSLHVGKHYSAGGGGSTLSIYFHKP